MFIIIIMMMMMMILIMMMMMLHQEDLVVDHVASQDTDGVDLFMPSGRTKPRANKILW